LFPLNTCRNIKDRGAPYSKGLGRQFPRLLKFPHNLEWCDSSPWSMPSNQNPQRTPSFSFDLSPPLFFLPNIALRFILAQCSTNSPMLPDPAASTPASYILYALRVHLHFCVGIYVTYLLLNLNHLRPPHHKEAQMFLPQCGQKSST
jgi:hypothetical protein